MPEDGHTIHSHATYEAFEEYGEDFKILAKNVADLWPKKKWPFQLTTKCFGFLRHPKYSGAGMEQLKGWVPEAISVRDFQRNKSILFYQRQGSPKF